MSKRFHLDSGALLCSSFRQGPHTTKIHRQSYSFESLYFFDSKHFRQIQKFRLAARDSNLASATAWILLFLQPISSVPLPSSTSPILNLLIQCRYSPLGFLHLLLRFHARRSQAFVKILRCLVEQSRRRHQVDPKQIIQCKVIFA